MSLSTCMELVSATVLAVPSLRGSFATGERIVGLGLALLSCATPGDATTKTAMIGNITFCIDVATLADRMLQVRAVLPPNGGIKPHSLTNVKLLIKIFIKTGN